MPEIYLVRHGQSEANVDHIWGSDRPLTGKGIEQALYLRSKLKDYNIDISYSALKKRAHQTQEIALRGRCPLKASKLLDEIYFGDLDGAPMTDEAWEEASRDLALFLKAHNGDDLRKRVDAAKGLLVHIAKENEMSCVVTSDTLTRSIIADITGKGIGNAYKLDHIPNCGITKLVLNKNELAIPDK